MHEVELFVALLVAVVLVALLARRANAVPEPVALVAGGLAIGVLPFAPEIRLEPDVIFLVFLPPILYPSAFAFAAEDLRPNLRAVGFLSIGLTLATIAAVAYVLHWVTGIPLAACFALGAVLGPTDPVAATAAIRGAGAPDRVATILEGESLINDVTALTALRIAIAAAGAGSFAFGGAVLDFVAIGLGGAVIGAALAWLTWQLRRRIDDFELEAAIAVLLAYGAFLLAEAVGASGILATVLAGWVLGRRSRDLASPETRAGGVSFWGVARFLSESILFLLIGLAFGQVLDDPATRGALELAGLVALAVTVTVAARFAWMATVPWLGGLFERGQRSLRTDLPRAERIAIAFGGLRGAVSVAAALTIPAQFPERETLIVVALGSIVVLLVAPALLLPAFLARLGLAGVQDGRDRERRARAAVLQAALRRAEELRTAGGVPDEVLDRVRGRYEWRLQRLGASEEDDPGRDVEELHRRVRRELLETERAALWDLRAEGEVSGEALRTIERELDLEAQRIG